MTFTPNVSWNSRENNVLGSMVSTGGGSGRDCPALMSAVSNRQCTTVGMLTSRMCPCSVSAHRCADSRE
eukprot:7235306-Lingulodinium_polyedra.AAC.1